MIIICDKCSKKFNVKDGDISIEGRSLQCGNCGNKWFFKPNINEKSSVPKIDQDLNNNEDDVSEKEINIPKEIVVEKDFKKEIFPKKIKNEKIDKKINKKKSYLIGYFFVTIITFIAIIIILDTFKDALSQIFPGIILLLDNLYQTLYDIYLFFKDLIN